MKDIKFLKLASPAILVGLVLFATKTISQNKYLPKEEYDKWHNFSTGPVTADGTWACYTVHHKDNLDTLYLKNVKTGFHFIFPSATNAKMTTDGKWLAMRHNDSVQLLDIKAARISGMGTISEFAFTQDDKYLVAYLPQKTLLVKNMQNSKENRFDNVKEYRYSQYKIAMLIDSGGTRSVRIVKLGDDKAKTFTSTQKQYSGLQWNTAGTALAFYETNYDSVTQLHFLNDKSEHRTLLPASRLAIDSYVLKNKLRISDDGKRLFFDVYYQKPDRSNTNEDVYVWKRTAKELSSGQFKDRYKKPYRYVWWPMLDMTVPIETDYFPDAVLIGSGAYTLLRSEENYKPVYKFGARYEDIYLKDLLTGSVKRIIDKISTSTGTVVVSPYGKFIAYYKESNWWLYNITSQTHTCLTKKSSTLWDGDDTERRGLKHVYGCGGWGDNDRYILLYDQYDVWQFSLHGGKHNRLTKGKEKQIRYRIAKDVDASLFQEGSFSFSSHPFNLQQGLLLKTDDVLLGRQGVAIWYKEKGTVDWLLKERKILSAKRSLDKKKILVIESAFDVSPRWFQVDCTGNETEIAQTNKQQKEYAWGKSELIKYNYEGKVLNAVLCYPAGFNPKKKYPMVVYIYEKMSVRLHDYDFPSTQNPIGFNRTNLTLEGYFVLMPDIEYSVNEVGNSALNCVMSAVAKVVETGFVDESKIGLMGHSFGGFETAYICSQTNLFKTAVVGAGVHDLRAYYLGMDTSDISNMERFWNGNFRNIIPFEAPDFDKESPLKNVKTIESPLLIWTGDADINVPHWHSTALHTALWRLGKNSTLLVYKNEEHSLRKKENKEDLTERIMQWFAHYLKNEKTFEWMD